MVTGATAIGAELYLGSGSAEFTQNLTWLVLVNGCIMPVNNTHLNQCLQYGNMRQYSSSLSIVSVVDIKPTSVSKHYIYDYLLFLLLLLLSLFFYHYYCYCAPPGGTPERHSVFALVPFFSVSFRLSVCPCTPRFPDLFSKTLAPSTSYLVYMTS